MSESGDMEGRVCVVTGANSGIGRATAVQLAGRGARVVVACRSEDKARPVIEEIGGDRADFLALDLADLREVRASASELLAREHPIHVLVNNAGLAGQRGTTADGFELHFGVNHLGHFLFTNLLLDRLRESAPARVVVVSSGAHQRVDGIDWDAVQRPTKSISGFREYGMSKLANVLHAAELGRRLEGSGVTTYSLHPGVIASNIWRRVPWPFKQIMNAFMKSPDEGARTSVYCAAAQEVADESGLYYDECRAVTPSAAARDEELARELWERSEAWTEEA